MRLYGGVVLWSVWTLGCRTPEAGPVDCDEAASAVWVRWPHGGVDAVDLSSGSVGVQLGSLCHEPDDLVFDVSDGDSEVNNVRLPAWWLDEAAGLIEVDVPVLPDEREGETPCGGGSTVAIWTQDRWGSRVLHDSMYFRGWADLETIEALQVVKTDEE